MAGELNIMALRAAGAAILAAPAPAAPPLEPWAEDLRAAFTPETRERHYGYGGRPRRGGYNAGYRCFACQHFVSGRYATCTSCGYSHGGINHDAQATR